MRPESISNMLLSLALLGLSCTGVKPPIQPTTATPTVESPQLSEKRRRGMLLENLTLGVNTTQQLANGKTYELGSTKGVIKPVEIFFSSVNYEVFLDYRQLFTLATQCGIGGIKENLKLEIAEKVFSINNDGKEVEDPMNAFSDGSVINILVSLDYPTIDADSELDKEFEVDTEKRKKAAGNLAVISFNQALMTAFCASAITSSELSAGSTPKHTQQAIQEARAKAKQYKEQIMTGQSLPAVFFRRKVPPPRSV